MKADRRNGDIDDIAAFWAVRIDRGPLDAKDTAKLEAWLASDSRHQGALARAQALLSPCGDFSEVLPAPKYVRQKTINSLRWGGGFVAAAAAAAIAFQFVLPDASDGYQKYYTDQGQMLRVTLADGSAMTLNTSTQVEVRYSSSGRHIRLLEGEGYFEVARDAQRPFVVTAQGYEVKAIGTAFTVRKPSTSEVRVMVQEGIVELDGALPEPSRLEAGAMAAIEKGRASPDIRQLDSEQLAQGLAWREGRIALTGETLAEAVAEFNRYNRVKLVVEGEARQREVVGWYSASDPHGFAYAVAEAMDLEVYLASGKIFLKNAS